MAISFPDSWQSLRFPHLRSELLEYLKQLARTDPQSVSTYDDFDIDETIHFFFDDTDLGDRRKSVIGEILFDEQEEQSIHRLTNALDQILGDLGDKETLAFIKHEKWPEVQLRAQTAMENLIARGIPLLSDDT